LLVIHREQHADVGDRAVGDPVLGPIEQPAAVGLLVGGGLLRRGVGSSLGLGQREAAEQLAGRERDKPLLLLGLGAKPMDRIAHERVVDAHDHAGRRAGPRDLLHREHVRHVIESRPAIRLGHGDPEEAELRHAFHELRRVAVLAIDLGGLG
jgi:hypothetical protein